MKKIALFVTAVAVSLSLGGKVLADTNTATFADKAGITPDNTVLYPIDKALDDLKVSIASGDDKKAEALVDVAEERLGESEIMADKEKTDFSNQAFTEYTDKMTEAQDKVADAIDTTSSSTTDSAIKSDELEMLETTIANRQMKSIEVLKNIENKASGTFKGTLSLVIEMQTRKKEAIVAVTKERQILLQYKKAVKEAEKNLEQAKKAGDEQAIKTAEDTLTQAQQTLATQHEKFNQVVAAKKEAMKGAVGELQKQAEKDQKVETNDASSSTNNTASEDESTSTGAAPASTNDADATSTTSTSTTDTTTTTTTDTNTANTGDTTSTTTQGTINNNTTVTNDTKTDVTVKENKGQEIKTDKENNIKENKNQDMQVDKENNPANENKVKH
jgi:Predicted solute binding protein